MLKEVEKIESDAFEHYGKKGSEYVFGLDGVLYKMKSHDDVFTGTCYSLSFKDEKLNKVVDYFDTIEEVFERVNVLQQDKLS
ncbi:MAG: hypothetical protein DRQ48_00920 [Gammaproteobacteria bacterium]|nr:MAG: hypothetical protein DRQ44_00450 [Gammaproteobacteria bacterium]RKZ72241.1 MAG: hypothetical protein DRQ48_00920 [Gammaproteobacteria bacterium]